MKILRSELLYKAIFYEDTLIGFVRDIIINPDNGKIIGFAIDSNLERYIAFDDCLYLLNRFFCKERNPVIDTVDVINTHKIVSENRTLPNKPVVNLNMEKIGYVSDFEIDLSFGVLTQIIVDRFKFLWLYFGQKRYIHQSKIHSITNEKVILLEDKEKIADKKVAVSKKMNLDLKKEVEPVFGTTSLN